MGASITKGADSTADVLHTLIQRQAQRPFDSRAYDRWIAAAYQRYPDSAKMLRSAVARAKGGQ